MSYEIVLVTGDAIPSQAEQAIDLAAQVYELGSFTVTNSSRLPAEDYDRLTNELAWHAEGNLIVTGDRRQISLLVPYVTRLLIATRPQGAHEPLVSFMWRTRHHATAALIADAEKFHVPYLEVDLTAALPRQLV